MGSQLQPAYRWHGREQVDRPRFEEVLSNVQAEQRACRALRVRPSALLKLKLGR